MLLLRLGNHLMVWKIAAMPEDTTGIRSNVLWEIRKHHFGAVLKHRRVKWMFNLISPLKSIFPRLLMSTGRHVIKTSCDLVQ